MNFIVFNPGNKQPFVKRKSTDSIILHHAAAVHCTPANIVKWHLARGFNGAGYNFFVAKDGTKYQLRPIWAIGAHTIGWNSRSIGICAEGNYEAESTMPEVQAKAIAEVIDYCNENYGKTLLIFKHRDKWPTACPGKNYPFDEIVKLSKAGMEPASEIAAKSETLVLRIGDKRPEVGKVQVKLNQLGYYTGKIDDSFGLLTLAAVKGFQEDNKLEVDGVAGPLTLTALAKAHIDKCPTSGIVTASVLNVRTGPGTNYKDIGDLPKGKEVRIGKQSGKWYNIYFGDHGGWVSAEYIKC